MLCRRGHLALPPVWSASLLVSPVRIWFQGYRGMVQWQPGMALSSPYEKRDSQVDMVTPKLLPCRLPMNTAAMQMRMIICLQTLGRRKLCGRHTYSSQCTYIRRCRRCALEQPAKRLRPRLQTDSAIHLCDKVRLPSGIAPDRMDWSYREFVGVTFAYLHQRTFQPVPGLLDNSAEGW